MSEPERAARPRIVLLVTSPRLPAGLLTGEAWDLVRNTPVFAAEGTPGLTGVTVERINASAEALLAAGAAYPEIVWLAAPDGDPALARELGMRLAREPGLAEMEVLFGSWDPPGARLLDVVATMDRLRSPGGCPWDAEQTHESLAPFLLEETYEAYDAIGTPELPGELGDVLLQVAFHARLGEEADEPWSIDDVAATLVEKLVRRHPHVFGDTSVAGVDEVNANWDKIKEAERAANGDEPSLLHGVAMSQPALSLAAKVISRAQRADVDLGAVSREGAASSEAEWGSEDQLGEALWSLVADATARGLDPEAALRRHTLAKIKSLNGA